MSEGSENIHGEIYEKTADEERNNRMYGVVCWFYVYKNNKFGHSHICGIVIIKQLIGKSSDKIFFYTETNHDIKCFDGHDCNDIYKNDRLIHDFIATNPESDSIQHFKKYNNFSKEYIIGEFLDLKQFLIDIINKNFDMFSNNISSNNILLPNTVDDKSNNTSETDRDF